MATVSKSNRAGSPLPASALPQRVLNLRLRQRIAGVFNEPAWLHLAGCLAMLAALALCWHYIPGSRGLFLREDSGLENVTAAFFLYGTVLGGFHFARTGYRPTMTAVAAGLCLLAFLDELSFGMRLFDFSPPKLAGVRLDSVHDLLEISLKAPAPATAVLVVTLWFFWSVRSRLSKLLTIIFPWGTAQTLTSVACIWIATALLLDLEPFTHPFFDALEETCELFGAVALAQVIVFERNAWDARCSDLTRRRA